jgi:hypothetical protein
VAFEKGLLDAPGRLHSHTAGPLPYLKALGILRLVAEQKDPDALDAGKASILC